MTIVIFGGVVSTGGLRMSKWTYVCGAIWVDTYDSCAIEKIEEFLVNAPKITGSEKDVEIFLNQTEDCNVYLDSDCGNCKFNDVVRQREVTTFTCKAEEDYKCPSAEFNTMVVMTLFGALRDRTYNKTKEEYDTFISELRENFDVVIENVKIVE